MPVPDGWVNEPKDGGWNRCVEDDEWTQYLAIPESPYPIDIQALTGVLVVELARIGAMVSIDPYEEAPFRVIVDNQPEKEVVDATGETILCTLVAAFLEAWDG